MQGWQPRGVEYLDNPKYTYLSAWIVSGKSVGDSMAKMVFWDPVENWRRGSHQPVWIGPVLLVIPATGCSALPVRTVEVTRMVREIMVVNQLEVVLATATLAPSPATPNPQASQASACSCYPTPSPTLTRWSAQRVLQAFQSAGLEVADPRPMTADDWGLVPRLAAEGTRYFTPSVCSDFGGRIMSFASQEDLNIVRDYYDQMASYSSVLLSWIFVRDNILVQINATMPRENAAQYETTLEQHQ